MPGTMNPTTLLIVILEYLTRAFACLARIIRACRASQARATATRARVRRKHISNHNILLVSWRPGVALRYERIALVNIPVPVTFLAYNRNTILTVPQAMYPVAFARGTYDLIIIHIISP